ncbi:hypothetical protein [Streptomyces sp. NPDC057363]|uniref:hypothetical protein n=1 Tax=Streptomyces sp. NPDC057363 TaxID=3346107 RepID=UPI003639D9B6
MSEVQDTADHLVVAGRGKAIADAGVADLIAAVSGGAGGPADHGRHARDEGARTCRRDRCTAVLGTVLVVLGIGGLSQLGSAGTWAVTGVAFAALGAGFATVMVTATATVVGEAPPGYAGVIGGLKQTAMNVGPSLGIAVAAGMMMLRPSAAGAPTEGVASALSASATGPTLAVLAGLAALALLPASLLPTQPVRRAGRDRAPGRSRHPHR